jgi:hypothetical protein
VLSVAQWDEEKRIARVTQLRGSHYETLGHNEGAVVCLDVEEAVYVHASRILRSSRGISVLGF